MDEDFAHNAINSISFTGECQNIFIGTKTHMLNLLANSFGLHLSRRKIRPKIELAENEKKSLKIRNYTALSFKLNTNYTSDFTYFHIIVVN